MLKGRQRMQNEHIFLFILPCYFVILPIFGLLQIKSKQLCRKYKDSAEKQCTERRFSSLP